MSKSYGSLMQDMWPPPSDDTKFRLQRLQELEQMRRERHEIGVQNTTDTSSSNRLNRRKALGTYRTNRQTVRTNSRYAAERGNSDGLNVGHGLSQSYDSLTQGGHGGARPKLSEYLTRRTESNGTSDLLAGSWTRDQGNYGSLNRYDRERTVSADSNTSDEQESRAPSKQLFTTNRGVRETSGDVIDGPEIKEAEHSFNEELEHLANHDEDIEQFKQSLYGTTNSDQQIEGSESKFKPFTLSQEFPEISSYKPTFSSNSYSVDKSTGEDTEGRSTTISSTQISSSEKGQETKNSDGDFTQNESKQSSSNVVNTDLESSQMESSNVTDLANVEDHTNIISSSISDSYDIVNTEDTAFSNSEIINNKRPTEAGEDLVNQYEVVHTGDSTTGTFESLDRNVITQDRTLNEDGTEIADSSTSNNKTVELSQETQGGRALVFDGERMAFMSMSTEHSELPSSESVEFGNEFSAQEISDGNNMGENVGEFSEIMQSSVTDFSEPERGERIVYGSLFSTNHDENISGSEWFSSNDNENRNNKYGRYGRQYSDQPEISMHTSFDQSLSSRLSGIGSAFDSVKNPFEDRKRELLSERRLGGSSNTRQSRREALSPMSSTKTQTKTTRVSRYSSLPTETDRLISQFRSQYQNRDYDIETDSSSYSSSTTNLSSQRGSTLSNIMKGFDEKIGRLIEAKEPVYFKGQRDELTDSDTRVRRRESLGVRSKPTRVTERSYDMERDFTGSRTQIKLSDSNRYPRINIRGSYTDQSQDASRFTESLEVEDSGKFPENYEELFNVVDTSDSRVLEIGNVVKLDLPNDVNSVMQTDDSDPVTHTEDENSEISKDSEEKFESVEVDDDTVLISEMSNTVELEMSVSGISAEKEETKKNEGNLVENEKSSSKGDSPVKKDRKKKGKHKKGTDGNLSKTEKAKKGDEKTNGDVNKQSEDTKKETGDKTNVNDKGEKTDELSSNAIMASNEGDHFETASDASVSDTSEKFFEASTDKILENGKRDSSETSPDKNKFTERNESLLTLPGSSKIRGMKVNRAALLGTSRKKKFVPVYGRRPDVEDVEDVEKTMESKTFMVTERDRLPSEKATVNRYEHSFQRSTDINVQRSNEVERDMSQKTFTDKKVYEPSSVNYVESESVTMVNMATQTLIDMLSVGIQAESVDKTAVVQALMDVVCPCCKHKFQLDKLSSQATRESQEKAMQIVNMEENVSLVKSELVDGIAINPSVLSDMSARSSASTSPKSFQSAASSKSSSPKQSPAMSPTKLSPMPSPKPHRASKIDTKSAAKSRKEKVNDVKKMLYQNGEQVGKKDPVPVPKPRRGKSSEGKSKIEEVKSGTKTPPPKLPTDSASEKSSGRKTPVSFTKSHKDSPSEKNKTEDTRSGRRTPVSFSKLQKTPSVEKNKTEDSRNGRRTPITVQELDKGDSESRDTKMEDSDYKGMPGYMQPTRSSVRKKSIGSDNKLELSLKNQTPPLQRKNEDSSDKKGRKSRTTSMSSTDGNEELFSLAPENFLDLDETQNKTVVKTSGKDRSGSQRSKSKERKEKSESAQKSSGTWYRKQPINDSAANNRGKPKSPRKSRSNSIDASSTENLSISPRSEANSDQTSDVSETITEAHESTPVMASEKEIKQDTQTDVNNDKISGDEIKNEEEKFKKPEDSAELTANGNVSVVQSDSKKHPEGKKSMANGSPKPPPKKQTGKNSSTGGDSDVSDGDGKSSGVDSSDGKGPRVDLSEEEVAGVPVEIDEQDDEVAPVRVNLSKWDPTKLLLDLYSVKMMPDNVQDISDKFIAMEGLMEKLPMNKKKATLLKTWKRRFFRAKDGWLHYFESNSRDKPSESVQLMGGKVDDLGNRILGIDDGRGKFLMVRCPTDKEYGQWKLALESQTADNVKATYVRPALSLPPHPEKKVILIDIGSSAVRAGILSQEATLPQLFFPSTVSKNKNTGEFVVGIDAYKPESRQSSTMFNPIHPTAKVDKFSIDMSTIGAVLTKVFTDLKVDPSEYWIMLSTPQNLADKIRAGLMEILVGTFNVKGVCMVMQSLLALYSYNTMSGIIVDIGERMEILPIYDGCMIEGGVSRQSYGGQKVAESLNSCLHKYKFSTPIDQLLIRFIKEQSCYVAEDYKDTKKKCEQDPDSYSTTVYLNNYDLPDGAHVTVTHDYSCFQSPEGFFNTDLWGMDFPCVHKLVFQAIQTCPIDSRKRMYRAIYLSGGVTMLPGFAERLKLELSKLAPPSVVVEVHASPQRYHSAFIGACALANMEQFQHISISAEEWKKTGQKAFKKWAMG